MLENFKETEESISLHGLGFIQVKLQAKQRLHVWHPDLPRRHCFQHSSIHDHRFSFQSLVLIGTQINHSFAEAACMTATHVAYLHEGERSARGNRPWIEDYRPALTLLGTTTVSAGNKYYVEAYAPHATEPGGDGCVATLMKKVWEGEKGAHSYCELGVTPDGDFDRKQWTAMRLWDIVTEVLGSA